MNDKHDTDNQLNQTAIYCLGRFEQYIEDQAKTANLVSSELTERVAIMLLSQAHGQDLGTQDRVSTVSGNRAAHRQALEQVALDDSAHRHQTQINSSPGRSRTGVRSTRTGRPLGSSLKGYSYNGTHWTQQPKNKARLRRLRKSRRLRG